MNTLTRSSACKVCGSQFEQPFVGRSEACSEKCKRARMASKAARRRDRSRAIDHDPSAPWHGTVNGYGNHCCRCSACSAANREYIREWVKRPEVAERKRAQARAHSKRPESRLKVKARQYGIDRDLLGSYLEDGICFACGDDVRETGGVLAVDHDHSCCPGSRKVCGDCVRGLLCSRCNYTLGMARDDPERLRNLIAYLERWDMRHASE